MQDEAKRMADDLENAQSLLQDAAQGKKPDFVELHGYPDKEDIEQSLCSIVREVTIAQELREKLPLGFVKPLLKRAAAQDGHIRRAEFA